MSNSIAVHTSNANLLRCDLHRLKAQVTLADPPPHGIATVGLGSYEQDEVLLHDYSVGQNSGQSPGAQFPEAPRGLNSDIVFFHSVNVPSGAQLKRYVQPLRFRQWLFCHVGEVQEYSKFRLKLLSSLPEILQRQFPGDSVSEGTFALFLKNARELGRIEDPSFDTDLALEAIRRTVRQVHGYSVDAGAVRAPELNVLVTNGKMLAAGRLGPRPFWYTLMEGSDSCELCGLDGKSSETQPQVVAHRRRRTVAIASQLTKNATGWVEMAPDSLMSVGPSLQLRFSPL